MFRLAVIACALLAPAAFGQAEAPTGFKVGDGRFHVGASLSGGYDSAVVADSMTLQPAGDIVLIPSALLGFDLNSNNTSVLFNGSGGYVWYTSALSDTTSNASHFDTNLDLSTAFNKSGPVEFQLGDNLVRSDRTQNPQASLGVLSLYNNARAAVPIHPGGGALEFTPRVNWAVEFFEPLIANSASIAAQMNYSNITPGLDARWKFLPKTAVVLNVDYNYQTYFNPGAAAVPASMLKGQLGLAGLISTKVSVLGLIGWAYDFDGSGLNTIIGQAEVSVLLSDLFNLKIGYARTPNPAPFSGTFLDDRGYAEIKSTISRFFITFTGAFDYLSFMGMDGHHDNIVSVGVNPGVKILPWFIVGASYNLYLRDSGIAANTYTRHVAMLSITANY